MIADRARYLAAMHGALTRHGFSPDVLARAIELAQDEDEWMPSIKKVIDLCEGLTERLERAIRLLEGGTGNAK